ncbi:MAG TPA: hypothetical protein VJU79_05715 [Candidatus Dormibacteraeota bacterium]|nr:hypothetical protein [Candidatus Dormibacteraeota bacterium]
MLRLTGLPNVARYPNVSVQRRAGHFELVFHGGEHTETICIDFRYLHPVDDLELTELELLDRLQRIGYQVERKLPEDEPGAGAPSASWT